MRRQHSSFLAAVCLAGLAAISSSTARAGFTSGSDGSDGALDCAWLAKDATFDCAANCFAVSPDDPSLSPCTFVVDLSAAFSDPTTTWETPGGDADGDGFGDGVYDANQWAVVYKFSTIDIPPNVIVKFTNHPSGAPVVWLAQGDVTIAGEVNLNGQDGFEVSRWPAFSEPGPGGFPGGPPGDRTSLVGSLGFGPGSNSGADQNGPAGCYSGRDGRGSLCFGGRTYGRAEIFPLIGGSGGGVTVGSTGRRPTTGGAGGGAILIATNGSLNLPEGSRIWVTGGLAPDASLGFGAQNAGFGSSGAIRLVSGVNITGNPSSGWIGPVIGSRAGGDGRLRIEAPTMELPFGPNPNRGFTTSFIPGEVFPGVDAPMLEVVSICEVAAPSEPVAGPASTEVELDTDLACQVVIRALNIPEDTRVKVRVVPLIGPEIFLNSTMLVLQGDGTLMATANVVFPPGRSEIQLRANWTPAP